MGIKRLKPTSPARRYQTYLTRDELTPGAIPEKSLLEPKKRISGRNNDGRITVRRRGGGHKRHYRIIDFKRDKIGYSGQGRSDRIRSEPLGAHRSDHLSRRRKAIHHRSGRIEGRNDDPERRRSRYFAGKCIADQEYSARYAGSQHRTSSRKRRTDGSFGRRFCSDRCERRRLRTASECLRVKFASVPVVCMATVGQVGNTEHENVSLGKAGRSRWMGKRPKVRGVAMNPVDHPHGGGEGKTSGGRNPVTPWGQPTRGYKTRRNKRTSNMIVKDRRRK